MPRTWLLLGLAACSDYRSDARDDGAPPGASDTGAPPTDSGPDTVTGTPELLYAGCALQADNVLRADCQLSVSPPAPVEVVFAPRDGQAPERATVGAAIAADQVVTAWGMVPETTYDWTARPVGHPEQAITGTWTTGALPAEVAIDFTTTGSSDTPDSLAFLFTCGLLPYAVIADPQGRIVWYQSIAAGLPGTSHAAEALTLTPTHTLLTTIDRSVIREFDLSGHMLLEIRQDKGNFDRPIHHDVFRWGQWTYALNAHEETYAEGDYVTDGVYVFDAAGVLQATFDLDTVVEPSGPGGLSYYWIGPFPGAIDWSHGNGIHVDADGQMYLSYYNLDTVLAVDGDPESAGFGTLDWVLAGSPNSAFPASDMAIVSSTGVTADLTFQAQHCPSLLPDGRLLLFDNERNAESRMLTMTLDPAGGVADIDGAYPLGEACAFEGGALPASNGNLFATCAPLRHFFEFAPGNPEPIRTMSPACGSPFGFAFVPRGIPILP
jgi:hypothetical protein